MIPMIIAAFTSIVMINFIRSAIVIVTVDWLPVDKLSATGQWPIDNPVTG